MYDPSMQEANKASHRANASRRASAANRTSENREKLLAAGAQLFANRGIAGVSVAEIIEAAGLSRATFYGFFANKNELAAAVLMPVFDLGLAALEKLNGLPPDEAANGLIDTYLHLWHEYKNALLLTGRIDSGVFPYIAAQHQSFNDALYKILLVIEAGGLLRNKNAALTLEVLARTGIPLLRIYNNHAELEQLYRESMRALIIKAPNATS
jgi:AcrR family transcriptional regulator